MRIGAHSYYVHRLVAAAFLDPSQDPRCWQVNHCDGNPSNNHAANLQYVTPSDNLKHAWATNSNRKCAASKLGKAVEWRRLGDEAWVWCASQAKAGRLLDVWPASISQACRGLVKKCRSKLGDEVYEFRRPEHVDRGDAPSDEIWRHAAYVGDHADLICNLMVSSHGRVSQCLHGRDVMSFGTRRRNGYFVVTKGGRYMQVHRLVAATFLGQPSSPELHVNHKDLNRGNNHVNNLEYVTRSENVRHAFMHRAGWQRPRIGKAVRVRLRSGTGAWQEFASIKAAASYTGLDPTRISLLCNGRDDNAGWEVRFAFQNTFPGEEWRPVRLDGARCAQVMPKGRRQVEVLQ